MPDGFRVALFAEDAAHRAFLEPMLRRVAAEESLSVRIAVISALGGHPRAMREFGSWHTNWTERRTSATEADIVVVAIDGNCSTFRETRERIRNAASAEVRDRVAAACPDPHIERWFMADPASFARVVGASPVLGPEKCEREHYKTILSRAVSGAGSSLRLDLDGAELAPDLAGDMSLYRAGKNCPSLGAFVRDLRNLLKRLAAQSPTGRGA